MKVGVHYSAALGPNPTGADYIGVAQHAEALGYHSLWVGDHLIIPKQVNAAYPYTKDGSIGFPPEMPWPDGLTLLAGLGAATKTIRLCTGVAVVPYRNPLHLAKAVVTADLMSNGRLELGVGVGWLREEFDALGIPFNERGARTDEYLKIMKLLWAGGDTSFDGRFYKVPDMHSRPLPVQKPHPPIIVGGHGPAAFRRVVALGDGWLSGLIPPPQMQPRLKELAEMMEAAGRPMSELRISLVCKPDFALSNGGTLAELEAAGYEQAVVYLSDIPSADDCRRTLDSLAKALIR